MLVIIYMPDGYWVGADSARNINGKRTETVCKVHETKFGLLLKDGRSQGRDFEGNVYSTDKVVEDLVATSTNAGEFKANLRRTFELEEEAELLYLSKWPNPTPKTVDYAIFDNPVPGSLIPRLGRGVLLIESDAGTRPGEVLMVWPKSSPVFNPWTGRHGYHYSATPYLDWNPIGRFASQVFDPETNTWLSFPASVQMFGRVVQYDRPDQWVQTHPSEALAEMLKLGHASFPEEVGPPYVIVHVTQRKDEKPMIHWVEKGVCRSWTIDIRQDDDLQALRDHR
jgi:hypothetical protein